MFSLLNKSKNYYLVEERCNILKNVGHVSNVLAFSPLNDIIFNKNRFLYPNKYNVYFKVYNIFSMFARNLSFYVSNHKVRVSYYLLFDVYKFSLRDFLKLLMGSDNDIFYEVELGTYINTYMGTHIYGSSNLSDTMIAIDINPMLYLNISPSDKNFHLDFGDIVKQINTDFSTFNISSAEDIPSESNKRVYNILTNIMYIKDMFLKYLHEEKFKDLNVYFYLNDEDHNSYLSRSSCYVKPNLVFFYDRHRKDFLFMYENVYIVENYHHQGRVGFYSHDLMHLKFCMIRVGREIEMRIIFEFNPDFTYDKIRFSVVNINGNSEEYIYNNNQEGKGYKKVFKDRFIESEERFRNLYIQYLGSIDTVFDRISSKSRFIMLNNNDL